METASKRLTKLRKQLSQNIRGDKADLKEWTVKLIQRPGHSMSFGMGAVYWAARIEVCQWVIEAIDTMPRGKAEFAMSPAERLAAVESTCYGKIRAGAGNPARSTSPMSNLMDQERTVAWAEILDMIE